MVVVADVADYKAMCLPSPGAGVIYDRVGPVLTHAQWARHGPGGHQTLHSGLLYDKTISMPLKFMPP